MAETIPAGSFRCELSATYNAHTIPREWRHGEALPAQTWGKVVVDEGELGLNLGAPPRDVRVVPGQDAIIPPHTRFTCAAVGGRVLFRIEYFHEPKLNDAASLLSQLGRSA